MSAGSSVRVRMAKGKVTASKVQEQKGKVLKLSPVQEEGLRRAFARKAILSPRFPFSCETLKLVPMIKPSVGTVDVQWFGADVEGLKSFDDDDSNVFSGSRKVWLDCFQSRRIR